MVVLVLKSTHRAQTAPVTSNHYKTYSPEYHGPLHRIGCKETLNHAARWENVRISAHLALPDRCKAPRNTRTHTSSLRMQHQ